MSKNNTPPGMQKFLEEIPTKVRNAGTDNAKIDCYECGQELMVVGPGLVSMHVFVYSDAPYYTTKALCFNCLNKAHKEHSGNAIGQQLN